MLRHLLLTLIVITKKLLPAIRAIAIYIKGIKIYPYSFDSAPAKLRLNCPAAIMQSVKGTRVIRAVQCTVSRSQRTLRFAS